MLKRALIALVIFVIFLSPLRCYTVHAADMNSLKGISHLASSKRDQVVVYLDKTARYNILQLSDPYRIVIDIENTLSYGGYRIVNVKSNLLDAVRFAQFNADTTRVVVDLKDAYRFEVSTSGRNLVIHVYPESGTGFPESTANNEFGMVIPKDEDKKDETGDEPGTGSNKADRGRQDRQGDITPYIEYSTSHSEDRIEIDMERYTGLNVMRLSGPDRVVIDFEGVSLSSGLKTISVNGEFVKNIRYAPFDEDTARVVVDMTGQHGYGYTEENGKLILTVNKLPFNYLKYHNGGSQVFLELEDIKLSESKDGHVSFYECWFDSTRKNMNISFAHNGKNIGNGEMLINDGYFKSIRVMSSSTTTTLTFMAKDRYKYNIDATSRAASTIVSILKPGSGEPTPGNIVVIDAGHGGSECGAVYGGIYEKDLNLDIALRLNSLLKSKGVNTYMIRETDVNIPYQKRGGIANSINAALFLSIHNNGTGNKSARGTETLCYSKATEPGFTGYEFAQIVQRHMVSTLGTVNRGIIERPNLAVLNSTVMPSALVEVAYMSNEEDLNLLKQPSFRQKAAEALCNAILEALEEMRRQLQ